MIGEEASDHLLEPGPLLGDRLVQRPSTAAVPLADSINSSTFAFPQIVSDIAKLASDETFSAYPALMRDTFKYLSKFGDRGAKPNYEKHLAARFAQTHARVQSAIKKAHIPVEEARMLCAFPLGGVQDNTVNRLLLMSSSERHLPSVPMAFFIKGRAPRDIG
jgi:hypothetical protein